MFLIQFAFVVLLEFVHLGQIAESVVRHECLIPGAECPGLGYLSNER